MVTVKDEPARTGVHLQLPTLYKRTSKGAIEQWSIRVEPFEKLDAPGAFAVYTEHGLLGGKLQESREVVTEGKNVGKANARGPCAQAEAQARSEWLAKVQRKGYTEDLEKARAGGNDGAGGVRPMLAHKFAEHGDKLTYPVYGQPKLDGIRCLAVVNEDGSVSVWSREQKRFTSIPVTANHVAILKLPPGTVLDGELYNHDLRKDFEKIASLVRQQAPLSAEDAALVQYHVYDIPRDPTVGSGVHFGNRTVRLHLALSRAWPDIVPVETKLLRSEEELLEYFEHCLERGYEGCMARSLEARNPKGKQVEDGAYHEGKRSYCLLKLKEFDEGEFPIVGVEEGVGKMEGLAVFTCTADNGNQFACKLEGSLAGLRKYLDDPSTWKGKKLTVQYQGLTNKAVVPRFPVGKTVRDYE